MDTADISQRYAKERSSLEEALRLWRSQIEDAAREFDLSVVVSGRVKSYRSVLGKVRRKPGVVRTWESLGDLVALKAVFPTNRASQDFTDWVEEQERWTPHLDPKQSAPHELKYQAMQFDLIDPDIGDSRGVPLKVELQVRTAAADAWYVVDHRLRYKGTVNLPDDLKRKLLRLIVLTELFDEEVEAVLASQAELPEYAAARLYERITAEADRLTGGFASGSRPEGLLELLLQAYMPLEIDQLDGRLTSFLAQHAEDLRAVIADHTYGSDTFVEDRDWLYYEPESLLIAERAVTRPAMLTARCKGADFEYLIESMANEFKSRLGPNVG